MRRLLWVLFLLTSTGLLAAPTFRVALASPPAGASWRALGEVSGRPLFLAVADGLLSFDPLAGLVKPGLALSWTTDEGGAGWTFTLKPARWSDGTPLTAQDFVDAWTRAGVRVSQLEAPDDRHLRVVFREPLADVAVLASPAYLLFPDPSTPQKGCGPFTIESQEPGRPLLLIKNPRFREAAAIHLDRLEFRFVSTLDEAQALYRDGLLDWVPRGGGPGTVAASGLKNAVIGPGWGTVFLRLNLRMPRLGDPAYREALSDALDRGEIAQGLRGPFVLPSSTLVPTESAKKPAKRGHRMGPIPEPALTILYPIGETYRLIALEVADQWNRQLGIAVETKAVPFPQALNDRTLGAYEVALAGWWGDYPDPSSFYGILRGGANDMGFSDSVVDQTLDRLVGLAPGKDRQAAFAQLEARLASSWPVIPLLSYATVNQIDLKRWSGWSPNPTDIHPWQGIRPRK